MLTHRQMKPKHPILLAPPARVAQSVGHLTRKSGVLGSIPGLATYFRFSFRFLRRAVVSYWRKYVHEVLVNRLGGLSLPRKSVVRLTDRPDMTLDVYRGRKTTMQQCNNLLAPREPLSTFTPDYVKDGIKLQCERRNTETFETLCIPSISSRVGRKTLRN